MKKSKKISIYKIFVSLSLIFGFVFSILIPLYQVPDEETHINMLYSNLGYSIEFSEETNDFGDTSRIIRNYDEKVNFDNYINFSQKLNIIEKVKKINVNTIRYLPQTIGIVISELFNLPIILSITLSEFLAVIFYTYICFLALKKMPLKKEVMMVIMLLPICIQQMGSFSYDMMLNCFSFLFIAHIFHFKFEKESINTKDLLLLLGILGVIIIVKVPYVLLGFLIFILPKEKITLLKKVKTFFKNKRILKLVLVSLTLVISFFLFFKIVINISYIKVLLSFLITPIAGILLLLRTIVNYIDFYAISLVGYFGWHDTPVSILLGIFVVVCLLIINFLSSPKDENYKLKFKEKSALFVFGVIFSIIIIISLFDWTIGYLGTDTTGFSITEYANHIASIDAILGVQGRYFIPILPLLIIPFDFNKKIKNKKTILTIIQIIYYVIIFVYMLVVILKRYWI